MNERTSLSGVKRLILCQVTHIDAHCRHYHSDQSVLQEISGYVYLLYKALHGSVGKLGSVLLYGIPAARERHLFSINSHYTTHKHFKHTVSTSCMDMLIMMYAITHASLLPWWFMCMIN